MKILSVLLLLCRVSSAEKHSLDYFLSAVYGLPGFPEFMATVVVDGVELGYCDSNNKTAKVYDWATEMMRNTPDHQKWDSELCLENQHSFRAHIVDIMQSLNQSGGAHVLLMMSGCEWDEETGETAGFLKYSYDGDDFMALDLKALTWTALKPEALRTKLIWDADKQRINNRKKSYLHDCPIWLKEYLTYGRKFLQQTVLPSVSFIEKSPSSSVSCFATGFYPDRAVMFWRKDGEELYEGVDHGEILPNNDGTFQMSADLNLSSVKLEDWKRYECVFQLSGVEEDIVTRLDTLYNVVVCYSSLPWLLIIMGVAAGLLLLSVCIAGFIVWRKKKNGYQNVQHA
ncbi:major histocompatibility complex class I-related gene protein-like [Cheilinus undulatus]|uniref:major histocompatibility complex class I-related gene protein-like n=1 Tax=Cheilinus undulatus TaxID=241271 RepID=UPI001BD3F588|nr:major histocompatibility complex class I-related gene protein-like [Cheilinus undulatus]